MFTSTPGASQRRGSLSGPAAGLPVPHPAQEALTAPPSAAAATAADSPLDARIVRPAAEAQAAAGAIALTRRAATTRPATDRKSQPLATATGLKAESAEVDALRQETTQTLAAFQSRLTGLLREGKANPAAALFVERALGAQATPEGCADLLEMVTEGSDWHLETFAPAFALGDAHGRSAPPSGPRTRREVAEAFRQTVGRAGQAALSRGTERLPRDHARATLAAAYHLFAVRKAAGYSFLWGQSVYGRPWLDALTASLPDAPTLPSKRPDDPGQTILEAPWRLPDHQALMQWIQATGMHSLPYALLVSGLMAHGHDGLRAGGSVLALDGATHLHLQGLEVRFRFHVMALAGQLCAEGWGRTEVAIFISAAATAINTHSCGPLSASVTAEELCARAVLPLLPERERAKMARLVEVVDSQLNETHRKARAVSLAQPLGLRRPAEIAADAAHDIRAEGAPVSPRHIEVIDWFKGVIAELRRTLRC